MLEAASFRNNLRVSSMITNQTNAIHLAREYYLLYLPSSPEKPKNTRRRHSNCRLFFLLGLGLGAWALWLRQFFDKYTMHCAKNKRADRKREIEGKSVHSSTYCNNKTNLLVFFRCRLRRAPSLPPPSLFPSPHSALYTQPSLDPVTPAHKTSNAGKETERNRERQLYASLPHQRVIHYTLFPPSRSCSALCLRKT